MVTVLLEYIFLSKLFTKLAYCISQQLSTSFVTFLVATTQKFAILKPPPSWFRHRTGSHLRLRYSNKAFIGF